MPISLDFTLEDCADILFKTLSSFIFYFLLYSIFLTLQLSQLSYQKPSACPDQSYFIIDLITVTSLLIVTIFLFGPFFSGPVVGPAVTFAHVFLSKISIIKGRLTILSSKGLCLLLVELLASSLASVLSPIFIYFTSKSYITKKSITDLIKMLLIGNEDDSVIGILLFETISVLLLVLFILINNDKTFLHYYPSHAIRSCFNIIPNIYYQDVVVPSPRRCSSASYLLNPKKPAVLPHSPMGSKITNMHQLEISLLKFTVVIHRFISATLISLIVLILRLMTSSVSGFEFNLARAFGPGSLCYLSSSSNQLEMERSLGILGWLSPGGPNSFAHLFPIVSNKNL